MATRRRNRPAANCWSRWTRACWPAFFAALATPSPAPAAEPSPDSEARAAAAFLRLLPPEDQLHTRFLSDYAVPRAERAEFRKLLRWWVRQLTRSPNPRNVPAPVPGSDSLLVLDLRDYLWPAAAWRAVALRDVRFREPWVSNSVARELRFRTGEEQPKDFQVVAVVDAWWFYRDTYQTQDSPSYYDLLFGDKRFVEKGLPQSRKAAKEDKERVSFTHPGGLWTNPVTNETKFLEPGRYYYERPAALGDPASPREVVFVDFPKTLREWQSAFLADAAIDVIDTNVATLRVRHGAVCEGAADAPGRGSYVARNNREVWFTPVPTGVYTQTFDVVRTSKERDLSENAFTDEAADKGRVVTDGGEALVTLPAGDGQAGLLFNAEGKRVEFADPNLAVNTRDARDRTVRTYGSCVLCHAEHDGLIPLANVFERDVPAAVDVVFKGGREARERRNNFDAFFRGWQDKLEAGRLGYRRAVKELTGWTGAQLARASLAWKDRYDDPVTVERAAAEAGVPPDLARLAASRAVTKRLLDLAGGRPVPRRAWDDGVFAELMLLLTAKTNGGKP